MVFALVWDENSVFQVVFFLHRFVSLFFFLFCSYSLFLACFSLQGDESFNYTIIRDVSMFILNFILRIFLLLILAFCSWFIKVFRSISKKVVTSMNFIEEKWGQCVWLQAQERATSADGFYRGGNEQETKATNFVHPPGFGIVKRSLRQKYSS